MFDQMFKAQYQAQVCFFVTCSTMTRSRLLKRELLHVARTLQMKGSSIGNKSGMDLSETNRGDLCIKHNSIIRFQLATMMKHNYLTIGTRDMMVI